MERCIDDELPFEIPESWAWVRWGAIAESIQYGYNAPAKQEGRIRMVRISDIHENTVAWSSVPFCDIDDSDIPTYLLQANDIVSVGSSRPRFVGSNEPLFVGKPEANR